MSAYDYHLLGLAGTLAAGAIGWQIVFGLAGALSLASGAAMGLGAYIATLAPVYFGWPVLLAAPAAAIFAAAAFGAAGLIVARLESHYLALATLALAEIGVLVALNWESVTGGANGMLGAQPPTWLDAPGPKAAFAWAAAALAAGMFFWFRRAHGRERLALLRAHPIAAKAFGVDAFRVRAAAIAVAAAAGALGGAAHATLVGVVSPDNMAFKTMAAILAVVIVGGRRSPLAAMAMAIVLTWAPETLRFLEDAYLVAYGLLLLAAVLFLPNGLAEAVSARLPTRRSTRPATDPLPQERKPQRQIALQASGLTRRFGGLTAVDDFEIAAAPGEILGLIGPNGAGKSTLLNLLSGVDVAEAGVVERADGTRIARTFQTPALVESDSALANIRASGAGFPAAWRALDAVGLADRAHDRASDLGQGDRRFLEIARAISIAPDVLLLDEPAAGLSPAERDRLKAVVSAAKADGAAILIVEHDVPFLAKFVDRLACMADGAKIAEGPPAEIVQDARVVAAYLGTPLA